MSTDLVLVTGGSGFLGSYCILESLRDGYRVRTTVRDLKRADEVRQQLSAGGAGKEQVHNVEFVAANLSSDQGWEEACKGCTYVLHVASPFPMKVPKDPNEYVSIVRRLARCADSLRLIVPAREGTLSVLKAAKVAGTVRRVVVTSSFAAIGAVYTKISSNIVLKNAIRLRTLET